MRSFILARESLVARSPRPAPSSAAWKMQTAALSTLLLFGACAGDSVPEDPDPWEQPGAPMDVSDPQTLEALTKTPEFFARWLPFIDAPASDEAVFVSMSDGVRIAVSLYYPTAFDRMAGSAPAVFIDTWYGRGGDEAISNPINLYREAGFVVVLGDSRGFGASFGSQSAFMTPAARRDQKEILDWISHRPWSNGSVAAVGISLSATLAEFAAISGAGGVKAAIIRNSDHDEYATNLFPGGIPNVNMLEGVDHFVTMARGEECVRDLAGCADLGMQGVDGDVDFRLLQAALAEHQSDVAGRAPEMAEFRDSPLGTGTWADISPSAQTDAIGRSRVPARVSASWVDGMTASGALDRFTRLPDAPMEVVISANSHMGGLDADPFSRQPFGPSRPTPEEGFGADIAFVKRVLDGDPIGHTATYFVLGAGVWKTTGQWPPANVRQERLRFSGGRLVSGTTSLAAAETIYQVDPTTSTGGYNRWASQRGGAIYYGDLRSTPGQRLRLDGEPFHRDTELVGAPEVCLALRSDQTDGIVIAYLEDVAPDGRVTHLTEGELRLLHRKTEGPACDPAPGAKRTFLQSDAAAVVPGELMRIELPLMPTAALIRKGHRLRVSLAGADEGTFPMLTPVPATWTISTGGTDGSAISLPLRDWNKP